MSEVVDKRGAYRKCLQVPSWEGAVPIEVIRQGLAENVAFRPGLERAVTMGIWRETREGALTAKDTS